MLSIITAAGASSHRLAELEKERILNAAIGVYLPRLNPVEVIGLVEVLRLDLEILRRLRQRRLHLTALVDAARLEHRLFSVPGPRKPEPRVRIPKHRLLKFRVLVGASAVGRDIDPSHGAASRPRQTGNLAESPAQPLTARRSRDHRLRTELEPVPEALPARDRICVVAAFVPRHVRLIDDADAGEPLNGSNRLPAGDDEAERIALMRTHRFAVLRVGHQDVVHRLPEWDAHRVLVRLAALGDDPTCALLYAAFFQQDRQQHARPFTATGAPVDQLNRLLVGTAGGPAVGVAP